MKQYQDLLQRILDEGCEKESGRPNMPHTWGIEDGEIKMDLREGFPLLTTKKMPWKMIVHELLWFLRGETNIKYLVDNNVNIWNGDAYRWYQKWWEEAGQHQGGLRKLETIEEFIEQVKQESNPPYIWKATNKKDFGWVVDTEYTVGDLGKVYGYQWRNQNGVDQVKEVLDGLKTNPYRRYHIIDSWNKADFKDMALPPCHLLYQFIVRPLTIDERLRYKENLKPGQNPGFELGRSDEYYESYCDNWDIPKFYLNLNLYQRSCDTFLGVPFNIASMSLLLMLFAKVNNMIPKQSKWMGGDVHIYMDHIPVVKEQINREPKPLPKMIIKKDIKNLDDILALTIDDFDVVDYQSDDKLFGELHTGYKK